MKKKRTLGIIAIAVLLFFGGATWLYFWGTSFSGDLVWKADKRPKPAKTLPELALEPQGWPWWMGPTNNDRSLIEHIKTDWSDGLEKLWQVNYLCKGPKSMVWSCPVIQGNRLVVPGRDATHDYIYCLHPNTGKLLWVDKYPLDSKKNYGQGHRATPTMDGHRVFTLSRAGHVRCYALYDGTLLWQYTLDDAGIEPPEWGFAGSPLVYNNLLILHGGDNALAIALNKNSGELVWQAEPGTACYTTPVLLTVDSTDYVVLFHKDAISFLDPISGTTVHQVPTGDYATDMTVTTPAVYQDYVFCTVLKGGAGTLVQFTKNGPEKAWMSEAIQSYQSNPLIIDDYIYSYSGMPLQNKGEFVCADLKTGEQRWSTETIGHGTCIYADGYLVCLDIKGNLYLVKPDPNEFIKITEFIGAIPAVEKRTWTKPVIAQDNLYLRHGNRLICYKITS